MNMLSLKKWDKNKILNIIDKAIEIKKNPEKYYNTLKNKSLAMLFQKTSTRTRISFEVAMTQLGGHALFINWNDTNLPLSNINDEIRYISTNTNIIMARMLYNKDINTMATNSSVPIINGCCEKFHPCQVISDMMTIKEIKGKIENIKLVYIGIHNNITNSLIIIADKLNVALSLITPKIHKPAYDKETMNILNTNPKIKIERNIEHTIKNADFIYTDSWVDMEHFNNPKFTKEKEQRIKEMMPYQINENLINKTDALIMHDMPIHEGYEITRDAIENTKSIIFKQSENRLHAQKAILIKLLSNK